MKKTILLAGSLWAVMTGVAFSSKGQKFANRINLSDFRLEQQQNAVMINWKVQNNIPTNYFEVEKSNDGKHFKTVAYVLGADPQKDCDCFECIDHIAEKSKEAFYRLKHIKEDGSVQYSETKTLALK